MEQSSSGSKHESILKWIESHTNPQSLEETLESIEKVNQIILTSSPEFIFRLNKDGTYLDYRAEDETQLYYSPSEFLGKNIADLFEVGPKVRDCIGKTVATGEISYQPYQLNIQGVLRKYFATISKLNSDEALILIQEISAPVSHRKRVIGPFSFATYSNEKRHKDNSSMSTLIRNVIPIPPPAQMLKMLVITSQPIMNQNEPVALLDIENERYRISQGLKASNLGVDLRYLCEATLNNVSNVIKQQWDIIHISSHGSKDAIWLEDGLGGTYALPITEFSSWFDKNTKLVVISACETLDVGQQLFDRLQNNVIAIQGSIDDTASGVFAQYFYQALGSNNIQDSFSIAQRAVSSSAIVDSSDDLIPWSDRFKLFSCTPCIFHASSGIIQERYIPEMSFISNLPKLPTNFVGRAKDLVEVVRLFEREKTPRVCVYGPGGIGKSEFAKFVASWMRDRGHVTTVLWTTADTAESENQVLDLLSLVERIQSLFNLSEKNNLERQKNQIYQFLKTNTALLVIDSWDNLKVKDRWPIWTFLNSLPYTTRVLITSRDTLPPIEVHNYELDRLDNDKSKVLFWKTLKNAGYFKDRKALSVEETQVLSEIVDTLEGYPLAVIVAAGQTRSKTLKQIQVDFQKKPKMVLEAVNEITSQPQGVWTSLNFSYNALTEIEQQVFRQISIFPESVVDSAIHAVTRVDLVDLSNILAALVRRSLIRRSKNLFSLHKIVREYGKSKLIESDESISELHQRAIDFYLIKYSQEGEMNNLINANYHLYILFSEFSKTEAGKLFLERYPLIFLHLVFTGSWAKAIHLAEEALNVATKLDNKKIIIQAYRSLGDITLHSRMRVETATKYISQSLKLALELEDKEEILKCLNSQGYLVYLLGDTEGAKKILRESLYLSKSLEDLKEEDVAECMTALGAVYMEEGSYTEAKFMLEQSMELLQSTTTTLELTLKDRNNHHIDTQFFRIKACKWKLTAALALFAKLEHKRGDLEVAKRLYMQYLNTCKEMENVNGIAESLLQLAGIYKEEKNYSESKSLYSMALQVAYGVQAVDKVIQITFATGELFYLTGDFEKARNHFSECLQQIQANCDPKMAIKVQLAWAKLEIENSMFENATKLLKRALGSAVEAKDDASVEKIKRYLTLLEDRELNVKKIDWSSEDSSTD